MPAILGFTMNQLIRDELASRAKQGHHPMSIKAIEGTLKQLGYRLDRSSDCRGTARYLETGRSYPCITTGIKEIDTGRSAFHFQSRRDQKFRALQDIRLNDSHFAVVRGCIFEL